MRFRILGPLEVVGDDGENRRLCSPRQKALLSLLLISRNQIVSVDRIIEELWGGETPAPGVKTLHYHVSKLRDALEPDRPRSTDGSVIRTRSPGYVVEVNEDDVDASCFERLVGEANSMLASEPRPASQRLHKALSMWRGRALDDVADQAFARTEAQRLEELRLAAVEDRFEADLAVGRHTDLVAELEAQAQQHPFRERLWGQLMLALYRSGRQAEALRAYQVARRTLGEELGIEPTVGLQKLEERILLQDENLELTTRASGPKTNAPARFSSFVGREKDLRAVGELIERNRLVTLTGVGGVGKTRLAIETTAQMVDRYREGIWWVELAPLTDPDLVPQAIAMALDIAEKPGGPAIENLADELRDQERLLILDNCEHLVDAVADAVNRILERAGGVKALTTSREVLHLRGEVVYEVLPLPTPPLGVSAQEMMSSDSVILFAERAAEIDPGFRLVEHSLEAAAEVCTRLDGIPLALELAAARLRVLTPRQLVERLDDAVALLTRGTRDGPAHHQTLQATLNWSYDLLSDTEQLVFDRLGVFVGGFTFDAVEQVCERLELETTSELLDAMSGLVDRSMVLAYYEAGETVRYRLFEPIRQYSLGRLEKSDRDEIAGTHAGYYASLVHVVEHDPKNPESVLNEHFSLLETDYDNLRAALSWYLEANPQWGLRLANDLAPMWWDRGNLNEARLWYERLLAKDPRPTSERAGALTWAAAFASGQDDYWGEREHAEKAIVLAEQLGDEDLIAAARHSLAYVAYRELDLKRAVELLVDVVGHHRRRLLTGIGPVGLLDHVNALRMLGWVAMLRGDTAQGEICGHELLELGSDFGNRASKAAHAVLGFGAYYRGDLEEARQHLDLAVEYEREFGIGPDLINELLELSEVALSQGDLTEARSLAAEARDLARRFGIQRLEASGTVLLVEVALGHDDVASSRRLVNEALQQIDRLGKSLVVVECLEVAALVAQAERRANNSARLLGWTTTICDKLGIVQPATQRARLDENLRVLKHELGQTNFDKEWAVGTTLTCEQAISTALEVPASEGEPSSGHSR